MIKLTPHQTEKLNESLKILTTSKRLLIKGAAGVGKTTLVNELLKLLLVNSKYNKKIYCSAPTNKALSVLQNKVDKDYRIEFTTTHSALKLKRQVDFKTGHISFTPSFNAKFRPLKGISLFIIDETSMIDEKLLSYIEEFSSENNTTVIFLGDENQLNPIGEENSSVFHKNYPEVTLIEIVRQAEGNPIIELSRNLSSIKPGAVKVVMEDTGYVSSNDEDIVIQKLSEVNGTDQIKYLAYTNVEVNNINKKVRQKIYGSPAKIEIGETLIFNSSYKDLFTTNQEILVKKLDIEDFEFNIIINKYGDETYNLENSKINKTKLKCYSINSVKLTANSFSNAEESHHIRVIHEDSEKLFEIIEKSLKQKAKLAEIDWKDYFGFVEQFADITYNHALTVHKSQGSTFETAIVNIKNINFNKNDNERLRLLYTAVTRASKLLVLYNN